MANETIVVNTSTLPLANYLDLCLREKIPGHPSY